MGLGHSRKTVVRQVQAPEGIPLMMTLNGETMVAPEKTPVRFPAKDAASANPILTAL